MRTGPSTSSSIIEGSAGLPGTSFTMSIIRPTTTRVRSPFSEVRDNERQATLFIVATSAVAASITATAALLVTLGFGA
jgi:hypothetical protein